MVAESSAGPGWRHGEYKVPGGKLVVVDLRVQGGRLHDVQLSGDFFLEPPETLDAISAALVGLPEDASPEHIVQAAQAAVAPDAVLYGITLEGVAVVIRRALS